MKPPERRLWAKRRKPWRETVVSSAQIRACMYRANERERRSAGIDGKNGATLRASSSAELLDSQACVRAIARVIRVNASRLRRTPSGVAVKVVYEVGPRLL
jgi:hypothetical protein